MTTFEKGQDTDRKGEPGEERAKDPASQVEKFPDFDYEESMRMFDAVMGEPDLDLESNIEDEVKEEFEEELESDDEEEMHRDDFFGVLSNNRRRTVLRYMDIKSDEAPFSLGELSEVVAAQENDKERKELTSDDRKKAYVGLYQAHLPDMDKQGLVEFNKDRGLIDIPEKEGDDYVFESMTELLEDEVYPDNQIVDEEFFERVFMDDEENEEDERYLSRLRQKLPF